MEHHFQVQGMTCGHCEQAVRKAIQRLDANAQIQIDRTQNQVDVQSEQPREALAHAIADEGYAVK